MWGGGGGEETYFWGKRDGERDRDGGVLCGQDIVPDNTKRMGGMLGPRLRFLEEVSVCVRCWDTSDVVSIE